MGFSGILQSRADSALSLKEGLQSTDGWLRSLCATKNKSWKRELSICLKVLIIVHDEASDSQDSNFAHHHHYWCYTVNFEEQREEEAQFRELEPTMIVCSLKTRYGKNNHTHYHGGVCVFAWNATTFPFTSHSHHNANKSAARERLNGLLTGLLTSRRLRISHVALKLIWEIDLEGAAALFLVFPFFVWLFFNSPFF